MQGNIDYQQAIADGHTPQDIQNFIKQNPNVQVLNGPTPQPQQPVQSDNTQSVDPNSLRNSALNFLLPTGGAILGGIAGGALMPFGGEILGGAGGAAGGQALADMIEGKKPGGDVALTGALGLVGGAGGKLVGTLGSKLLAGAGEDLATGGLNLTKRQLAKYAANYGEDVGSTLKNSDMAGVNPDKLEEGINSLQQEYNQLGKNDTVVNPNTFLNNSTKVIEGLRAQAPQSAKDSANEIEQEIQQNLLPKLNSNSTLSDYNKLKAQYDSQTTNAQFNKNPAQWNINRAVGDILRKTVNDGADEAGLVSKDGQPLSAVGNQISKLKNIQDLAEGREGIGGSPFNITNLLLGGEGGLYAHALGANPITGLLLPGSRMLYSAVRSNPTIASLFSTGANNLASGISKATPALKMAGILGGLGVSSSLVGGQGQSNQANGTPNSGNPEYNQFNSPSSMSSSITRNKTDVNTIPTFDHSGYFPQHLPNPSQMASTVPGQVYSPQQQMQDMNRYERMIEFAGGNPVLQSQADEFMKGIQVKSQLNSEVVSNYIQQLGLQPQDISFIRTAEPTYDAMNTLRDLVQKNGAGNFISAIVNGNKTFVNAKINSDPSGEYAEMNNLMGQLAQLTSRMTTGGSPSEFQTALDQVFSPGRTVAANLRALDMAQSKLLDQYQQYAPYYGLLLNATQGQQQAVQGMQNTQVPILGGNSAPGGGGSDNNLSIVQKTQALTGHPVLDNLLGVY